MHPTLALPQPRTLQLMAPFRALECRARAAWLRGALRLFAPRAGEIPDWGAAPRRVLFVRHDGIGDLIMSTGLLRALTDAPPGLVVDVLTSPGKAPALAHLPFIGRVIVHERGGTRSWAALRRELRAARYDAVIDGGVGRPSVNSYTARILLACGARWRIGSGGRRHDFMFNTPVLPPASRFAEHHVTHLARLAAPFGLGAGDADWRPTLALSRDERVAAWRSWRRTSGHGQRILVNLSAGSAERRWPDERFAALLRRLRQHTPEARVIVVALPSDRDSALQLAAQADALALVPDVRALIALVATSDIVISPDTAVTHIASAFQRPTLALMRCRAEFQMWTPYRTPGVCVFGDDAATLHSLPTPRVLAALDELLDPDGVATMHLDPIDDEHPADEPAMRR